MIFNAIWQELAKDSAQICHHYSMEMPLAILLYSMGVYQLLQRAWALLGS